MCGRYANIFDINVILDYFGLTSGKEFTPSYNIAPKTMIPAISQKRPDYLDSMQWSLVPWWSQTRQFNYDYINIRTENIFESKTTSKLLQNGRCIIPASGFYEWKKKGNTKIPHYFTVKNNKLFGMAGLYSVWNKDGNPLVSTAIITTTANQLVNDVHKRMPVILDPGKESVWLDSDLTEEQIKGILKPLSSDLMTFITVSDRVNSPKNNDLAILDEVDYTQPIKDAKGREQSSFDDFF